MEARDLGLGQLFWELREAIVVGDAERGRIVLWNPAAEVLLGYSADEARHLPLEVLVPERFRARHQAGLARYRATGRGAGMRTGQPMEVVARRKDGAEVPIELTLSPIRASAGDGRLVLALMRDLTERRRAEAERLAHLRAEAERREAEASAKLRALAAEEARQRALFLALQEPIVTTTCDGYVTGVNPAGGALFGDVARVYGRSIRELLPFVGTPLEVSDAPAVWRGPLPCAGRELLEVEVRAARLGETHLPACDVYIVHDVSSYAALTQAREELLYAVAHELRGPLGVLEGVLEMLVTKRPSPTETPRLLRIARRTARRLRYLMEGMLSAGAIEAGRLVVHPEPTDVAALVGETVGELQDQFAARGQRLEQDVPPDLPPVLADRRYARQVLVNLLGNAAKYGPAGEALSLAAERAGGQVRLKVHDRGAGIPPEEQVGLFERFYRAGSGRGRPGIGLGLRVARGIVEAHGGEIGIESAPGHGTTVWFTLPTVGEGSVGNDPAGR